MNKLSVIEIQLSSTQEFTHIFIAVKATKNRHSDLARLLSTTSFVARCIYHNPVC